MCNCISAPNPIFPPTGPSHRAQLLSDLMRLGQPALSVKVAASCMLHGPEPDCLGSRGSLVGQLLEVVLQHGGTDDQCDFVDKVAQGLKRNRRRWVQHRETEATSSFQSNANTLSG